jgi:hypothetical protein
MTLILKKQSISVLGKYLVPLITEFVSVNQKQFMDNPKDINEGLGAEALANAIAYGIAKALSSPMLTTALAPSVFPVPTVPPVVVPVPVGPLVSGPLSSISQES